jgi:hypothetical protein
MLMRIFGKSLSEYVKFEKVFLILVLLVGLGRLGASLAGVSNSMARFLSLTALLALGLIYYSIRVYTSGFGSYKQLYPILFLQWITAQSIVILGILLAMSSGKDNIFSAPEYSGGQDGKNMGHIGGHLLLGVVAGPLVAWLLGSLIMLVAKKIAPRTNP